MPFTREETGLPGLCIIRPAVFGDSRGWFKEMYSQPDFQTMGIMEGFVQDNLSFSQRGTVRGLHFQAPPHAQAKLVTVLQGEALDVALDLRTGSPTFGQVFSLKLRAEEHTMFFVPAGFAHGYAVLSETCLFQYKVSGFYNREAEGGVLWNDPALGIDWGVASPILSEKDTRLPAFAALRSPFVFES